MALLQISGGAKLITICIRHRTLSLVAAGRQGQTCKPVGTTLRQTDRITHKLNCSPLLACLQYFRSIATLFSIASASSFLSLAFSSSSDFRRLTSGTAIPPYRHTSCARCKKSCRKWRACGRVHRLQSCGEY